MKDNNVPDWYIESCGKIKYMFPKAHAAAYVMMALRVAYFKVHHPIYYYCAYFSIRAKAFDLASMSGGLDKVKAKMDEIALKKKNNEASNVENDLYTTLEIVNEMLERGFKFGKLDLYKSDATEFLIENEDTLIPPFVAMDGLGRTLPNSWSQPEKKENSSPRRNCASGAASPAPWSKKWMRWAFWARCQRTTNSASLMNCFKQGPVSWKQAFFSMKTPNY